ncbi:MAG: DNA photolyase [Deltaproteobacteria bacterium]|nr:DNA photolyase [Deltaproteobacteria bacterium]
MTFINKVFIDHGSLDHAFARNALDRVREGFPDIVIEKNNYPCGLNDSGMGKDTLHFLPYKGEFLKPCPGTKEYICCGYNILNIGTNCPLDCSYCILQSYINIPNLRVFANLEEELGNVLNFFDSHTDSIFRVGTGEFTDSLAIDPITFCSDLLIPEFSKRKNVILELKTKTININRVLASKSRDRIVVSWSLNSPYISSREEIRAPGIKDRLEAARKCQSEGFVLGFHFDPLIIHPGWRDGYLKTLDLMDKYIDPKGIIWISLGSFRYMPALKRIVRKRHPGTIILDGEFIQGLDGKMRYFKPIRIDIYSFIKEHLNEWHPNLGLYLCMESDDVWHESIGWSPGNSQGLKHYLDVRTIELFG